MDTNKLNQLIQVYNDISTISNARMEKYRQDIIMDDKYPDTVLTSNELTTLIIALGQLRGVIGALALGQG